MAHPAPLHRIGEPALSSSPDATAETFVGISKTRLRISRAILGLGAICELFMISALPVSHMTTSETLSFLSLAALLVISGGSAISMRRWSRESIATLAVGSVYASYLLLRAAIAFRQRMAMPAPLSPPEKISFVLALGTLATLPVALIVARPSRGGATPAGKNH